MTYKVKRFTRAEKDAIKEFYKATNGLRFIPKGYTGMNARDIVRFEELADQIKGGGQLQSLDREKAKYLLDKIGLPKVSQDLDHLINKYSNKRLLARYRRARVSKELSGMDPSSIRERLEKIKADAREALNADSEQFSRFDRKYGKFGDTSDKAYDLNRRKRALLRERHKNDFNYNVYKDPEYIKFQDRVRRAQCNVSQKRGELLDNRVRLKNKYLKRGESVIRSSLKKRDNKRDFSKRHKEAYKVSVSSMRGRGLVKNQEAFEEAMKHVNKNKNVSEVAIDGKGSGFNSMTGMIRIHKSERADPFTLLHEEGHANFEAAHPSPNRLLRPIDMRDLASELGASGHAMSRAKRLNSLKPGELEAGRKSLEHAYNTYFQGFLNSSGQRFALSPNRIRDKVVERLKLPEPWDQHFK